MNYKHVITSSFFCSPDRNCVSPKKQKAILFWAFCLSTSGLHSCKRPFDNSSQTREVISTTSPNGSTTDIRRCDLSTLDLKKVLKVGATQSIRILESSSNDLRDYIAYSSMFSFEYLFCLAAGLGNSTQQKLTTSDFLATLSNANIIEKDTATIVETLAGTDSSLALKRTQADNSLNVKITISSKKISSRINSIKEALHNLAPIGKGVTKLTFSTIKRGYFPVRDARGFNQKKLPDDLFSNTNNTGYSQGDSTAKSTIIVYRPSFPFASWLSSNFTLLLVIDDELSFKLVADTNSAEKKTSKISLVDVKGIRLFGVVDSSPPSGDILSAFKSFSYERVQVGVYPANKIDSTIEDGYFLTSVSSKFDFSKFFNDKQELFLDTDKNLIVDGLIYGVVAGTIVNLAEISAPLIQTISNKSSNSLGWITKVNQNSARFSVSPPPTEQDIWSQTHPTKKSDAISKLTAMIAYTSLNLFGSTKHINRFNNAIRQYHTKQLNLPAANRLAQPAKLLSKQIWEESIKNSGEFKWDVKSLQQKVDANGYYNFISNLRKFPPKP